MKKSLVRVFVSIVLVIAMILSIGMVHAAEEGTRIELENLEWQRTNENVWWMYPYTHDAFPAGVEALMQAQLQDTNNSVSAQINVDNAGTYLITLGFLKETDGAVIQMSVDGVALAVTVDSYNAGGWQAGSTIMGAVDLTAGQHEISFKSVSTDTKHHIMLDYIKLDAISDEIVFEFEKNSYTKSADSVWLHDNFEHEFLPVPAAIAMDLNAVGAYIETNALFIPKAGKYKVTLSYILDRAYDTVQISIDGVNIGEPVNAWHDGGWEAATVDLGNMELAAGAHKITITAVSGNSGKYSISLDSLKFTVAEDEPEAPDTPDTPDNPNTGSNMGLPMALVAVTAVAGTVFVVRRKECEE